MNLAAEMAAFKAELSSSIEKVNRQFEDVALVAVAKRCVSVGGGRRQCRCLVRRSQSLL